ncbi:MAG: M20/M25/M40 family metallo-hydrolase, partial [Deinococcales bacterium]
MPIPLPSFDSQACAKTLVELLSIPSPTGFTHYAMAYVEEKLKALGLNARYTSKGALLWTLKGQDSQQARSVAMHIDTLGAMVKEIKEEGRLKLSKIGGYDWSTIEGEYCLIHASNDQIYSGTVLNTTQSAHIFGPVLAELKRSEDTMEVRLDEVVHSEKDVRDLGIEVGDFISWDSRAEHKPNGFIKGRHLDNKASVAICLEASAAFLRQGLKPLYDIHFFVSNYEEVGHGAATGIPSETKELLCLDMA